MVEFGRRLDCFTNMSINGIKVGVEAEVVIDIIMTNIHKNAGHDLNFTLCIPSLMKKTLSKEAILSHLAVKTSKTKKNI